MKKCAKCGEEKPRSEFYFRSDSGKLRDNCKPCHNVNSKANNRRRRYGLHPDEYEQMHATQRGLCAICKDKLIEVVDHCHTTGAVRSLLCRPCNWLIGHAFESPEILREAASYIESWHSAKLEAA